MKKVLLFTAMLLSMEAFGQAIPNNDFENWDITPFDEPNGWYTSNTESYRQIGVATVSEVTGQSGSAIRLETKTNGTDTSGGFFINSFGDPLNGEGGVPYSQQPTHITGYYKYTQMGSDSAIILAIFKKNGFPFSVNFFKLGPAATYTQFNFALNALPIAPDSVIIGAASSNLIDEVGVMPGSILELDELEFTGPGITQGIPNGDLESWTTNSFDKPVDWDMRGEGVSRTSDSYSGAYAVELRTIYYGDNEFGSSDITNGMFDDNGQHNGGRPYTESVDTLTGYYKYITSGQDSGAIHINLSKNGNVVGGTGFFMLEPAANYTYFEIPFNASSTPDSLRIEIMSSVWPYTHASANSTLIVDDLQLKSNPVTAIKASLFKQMQCIAYPNPVHNVLNLKILASNVQLNNLRVYDISGKLVIERNLTSERNISVDTRNLKPGTYFYELSGNGEVWKKDRFVKE